MFFFTSDNHFGDDWTFKQDMRPFKSVKQCDNYMLKQLNKRAKKEDTIYFVGDFFDCDGPEYTSWRDVACKYVSKIKAKKILIIGNNEERIIKYFFKNKFNDFKQWCLNLGFAEVVKHAMVSFNNHKYYLVHKPTQHKAGVENLFGHVHRFGGVYKGFGINVSADLHYFKPLDEFEVEKITTLKNNYSNNKDVRAW